jgi:hypothetical protein
MNEKEREFVRVEGSPVHCPYCKGELADLKEIVACAACGARHHESCHESHGRCATCGATEKLVPQAPRRRSRADLLPGSKIQVEREGNETVYSWSPVTRWNVAFMTYFLIIPFFFPVGLWILLSYLRNRRTYVRVTPDEIEFTARRWPGARIVRARRSDLGKIGTMPGAGQGQARLAIDVGIERYELRCGTFFSGLKPPELEWLADQLTAWKESGV